MELMPLYLCGRVHLKSSSFKVEFTKALSKTQSKTISTEAEKHLSPYFKTQSKTIGTETEKHLGSHFKTQSKTIGIET